MAAKDTVGRPSATKLADHLLNLLQEYLFSVKERKSLPKKVPETNCQVLSQLISRKLRDHVNSQAPKQDIITLLKTKLKKSEIEDFKLDQYPKELLSAKTLKRSYESGTGTKATADILQAFYLTHEEEDKYQKRFKQEIKRVAGLYYEYNIHNTNAGTFQESLIDIDENGKSCTRFTNSSRNIVTLALKTQLIGTTGLLLSHEDRDYVLIFYLYIGKLDSPRFLQGIQLYSNREGNTVANLAVLQRIITSDKRDLTKAERQDFITDYGPTRERKTLDLSNPHLMEKVKMAPELSIGQNIQRFLYHKVSPISTELFEGSPFDFAERAAILPAYPFGAAPYYDMQQEFAGEYDLYFNERYPATRTKDGKSPRNPFFSSVGIAKLSIEVDDVHGQLNCQLEMRKNANSEKLLIYRGKVVNQTLRESSLLLLSLYLEPAHHRYLQLVFSIIDNQKLVGCFTTAYTLPNRLGCGVVVATRQAPKENPAVGKENKPIAVVASEYQAKGWEEQEIVNYLSRNRQSLVLAPDKTILRAFSDTQYQGIYRMYFPSTKDEPSSITTLIIYRNGQVEVRSPSQERTYAIGECLENNSMLNITLRYEQGKHMGFCCIRMDKPPRDKELAIYDGSFAGYSLIDGTLVPIARPFKLEFIQIGPDPSADWENHLKRLDEKNQERSNIPSVIQAFLQS